ncbi:MAG: TetR/AcrR family transcriptional regulator [Pseudomonadota bacterium]
MPKSDASLTKAAAKPQARTQRRGDVRRKLILDSAYQLIAEGGLEAATMTAISRLSGVPVSSLYDYFPSRQDIAAALAARELEILGDATIRRAKEVRTPAELKIAIRSGMTHASEFLRGRPGLRNLWVGMDAHPQFRDVFDKYAVSGQSVYQDMLAPFSDTLNEQSRHRLTHLILRLIRTVGMRSALMDKEEGDKLIDDAIEMAWLYVFHRLSTGDD